MANENDRQIINTGVDNIIATVMDIKDDLSTLRPLLRNMLFSAYATDKIENAPIASFPDGADAIPVKSAAFAIVPQQDLHGYEAPWPAGGGKNLSPTKSGSSDANGRLLVADIGTITEGQTYTLSLKALEVNVKDVRLQISSTNQAIFNTRDFLVGQRVSRTFTANASGTLRLNTNSGAFSASTDVVDDIQLELGSTATSYAPYSNICPISGFTGAEITAKGVNLFDKSGANSVLNGFVSGSTGVFNASSAEKSVALFLPRGTYTISKTLTTRFVVASYDNTPTNGDVGTVLNTNPNLTSATFTLTDPKWVVAFVYNNTGETTPFADVLNTIQVEVGSIATSYHASVGTTHDITWQDEAGTVYGGTIAYLGGNLWRLTATHENADLGTLTVDISSVPLIGSTSIRDLVKKPSSSSEVIDAYCSAYKVDSRSNITNENSAISVNTGGVVVLHDDRTIGMTQAQVEALLNGIIFCYPLATPVTYDLTAEELATVLGTNNVFANTGDVTELVYRADTTLFVEKKLAE